MKIVRFFLFFAIITTLIIAFVNISNATLSSAESKRNGENNTNEGYDFFSPGFKDTTIKIVWREDIYDQKMKANVNVIILNEDYFKTLSEPEKAVLGYLASTIGNECYNDDKNGVSCKLLTALNMGAQCSEQNKQFLSSWFANEPAIMKQIENCKPTLPGSTTEKTFDVVKISTSGDVIKVSIKGLKLNIKENSVSEWSENITFKVSDKNIAVNERTKND